LWNINKLIINEKKLKKIVLVAFAMLTFSMGLLLSIDPVADGSVSFGVTSAQARTNPPTQQPCWVKSITRCRSVGTTGGGQRVICDATGAYGGGDTCTPISCTRGAEEPLACRRPPQPWFYISIW